MSSGLLNPMRSKNRRHIPGGGKGRHLWPRLVRKIAEGNRLRVELESKSDYHIQIRVKTTSWAGKYKWWLYLEVYTYLWTLNGIIPCHASVGFTVFNLLPGTTVSRFIPIIIILTPGIREELHRSGMTPTLAPRMPANDRASMRTYVL